MGVEREIALADTRRAVVHEDVLIGDRPAFLCRVELRVLNLARDGLLFVTHTSLFGRFTSIDSGFHSPPSCVRSTVFSRLPNLSMRGPVGI